MREGWTKRQGNLERLEIISNWGQGKERKQEGSSTSDRPQGMNRILMGKNWLAYEFEWAFIHFPIHLRDICCRATGRCQALVWVLQI